MAKTKEEKMVDAIMKDDALVASLLLEAVLQEKCAKKIKDTLSKMNDE